MDSITVHPVTMKTWGDFVRLFQARGGPHYCWCTPYRFPGAQTMSRDQKTEAIQGLVIGHTPVGVLAYVGQEPVGWCSVAPRETYARLDRSRTMPRVTPTETPTWTVLCFFVVRGHRGQGLPVALLRGAVDYARSRGAVVVEGYPFDSAGITSTHRGHSRVFRQAGFIADGSRWSVTLG
jgi:GNAT superfamily N-acetyltransferase